METPDVVHGYDEWWKWANEAGCTCLDVEAEAACPIRNEKHPKLILP